MAEPPAKKLKSGSQTFKDSYTEEWPCLVKSRVSIHHAFCTVCSTDISIGHSGRFDCRTHVNGAKHQKNMSSKQSSNTISNMFKTMRSNEENSFAANVTRAEVYMTEFIAKHNLSLSVADELPELVRQMCPDSAIAKDLHCKRSKTTALMSELALMSQENIIKRMKEGPFTISTDGSNDMGSKKLFPLVVRSVSEDGVHSEVLSVPDCEGSATGEKIFSLVNSFFEEKEIPWKNCIAIGCDNANVMAGSNKGFYGYCKEKNSEIFLSGCPLHLVHIAAERGAKTLPISPHDLLVDIYYFFKKSSLRCHRFAQFQELHGKDQLKMLKHGATRWLSMGRCLDRLLLNWDPLKEFFKGEVGRKDLSPYALKKVEKMLEALQSRSTRLYLMFMRYSMKTMESFLTVNQSDSPRISVLLSESNKLIRSLMTRFLCPSAFSGNKPVQDVDFKSTYNFKANKDIVIGEECKGFISNRDKNGLSSSKLKVFYKDIIKYFQTIVEYLLKSLPVSEPVFKMLSVSDPVQLATSSTDSVRCLAKKFPILIPKTSSIDILVEQFCDFQSRPFPFDCDERIDKFWLRALCFKEGECKPFADIANFMLGLLTIPHSSAHCERVFSCVRKIKTDQRSSLATKTLENLLIVKHKQLATFSSATLSSADIKRLKSAYKNQLVQN